MKSKFSALALSLLTVGGAFVACTSEDAVLSYDKTGGVRLVKAPEVVPTGSWFETPRSRGNQEAPYWNGETNVKPADITDEELDVVVAYFRTHEGKSDAVEYDFSNFYVQQVYYADDVVYELADGGTTTPQRVINQINTANCSGDNVFSGNDQFNKCRYVYNSSTKEFWYDNTSCGVWVKNFKMVYIPGYGYYVGFDGEGKTPEEAGDNKNQIITNSPDNWYYDRIIKIVPADENGNILPLPKNPDVTEPEEPGSDNPDVTDPDDPTTDNPSGDDVADKVSDNHKNEVEVNLAVDEHNDYQASHLSVHIRYAGNVEIFIPIESQYTCEADDMEIVMKHEPNHMIHGGQPVDGVFSDKFTFTYTLKDSDLAVSVTICYEENGIRITTSGITQEVIDWCQEKCQDGITFEVWNYFNDAITKEELKKALDKATIEFLGDELPDYYINAFNDKEDGTQFEWDCTVSIVDEQRGEFANPETGEHLNDSRFNEIYKNNNAPDTGGEDGGEQPLAVRRR